MTPYKETSREYKWECNERDDLQTDPNGVIHAIIMHEDEWAEGNAEKYINNSSDQFPFPRNRKNNHQNK